MNPCPLPPASGSALGLMIRQVRDGLWAQLEHELTKLGHDLTFSQYIVIKKLAAEVTPSASDLAKAAEMNPGAMTRLLDKLEARGLITRAADPADRRALHIKLTPAGEQIWSEIGTAGQGVLKRALTGMTDEESGQLMALLTRVRDNLSTPTP
ncbi:MarR family winged helix-turn-helix transcriptional regulator [Pseudoxanthomonas composti]|uniref:MarR family transcriptional regulator n=1 Tax=Pseudoxanthomonas composti TaxID=2137479 RepID=A0A4Q1JYT8_9GAMM|nr:MarR family transcriptional regulator [Pseudoxanthomonas composti]RXR08317.1 MarR family transcriptional regulator [Pseudoxanthomonas composti]